VARRARSHADTRAAILDAALRVFGEVSYARGGIDAVARAADVAKPTVYNYFDGKEQLFRAALATASAASAERTMAAIRSFPTEPVDLAAELVEVGDDMVRCLLSAESTTVRRLVIAESARFGDLHEHVRASGPDLLIDVLAGRIAHLAYAGHLRAADPLVAARHFVALVTSDLALRATMTQLTVTSDERRAVVETGVATFLAAFGTPPAQAGSTDGLPSEARTPQAASRSGRGSEAP
jgi:AcrR family transcriptional regulator